MTANGGILLGFFIVIALLLLFGPPIVALTKISSLRQEMEDLRQEIKKLSETIHNIKEQSITTAMQEKSIRAETESIVPAAVYSAEPPLPQTPDTPILTATPVSALREKIYMGRSPEETEKEAPTKKTEEVTAGIKTIEKPQMTYTEPEPSDWQNEIEKDNLFKGVIDSLKNFIRAGNSWVTIGVGVLIIGLGFFAQYAAKQGLFPVELRLALVALCGITITAFGWRLREKKFTYALILQGGGVGTLYLTIFATLKLTSLLPVSLAFTLLTLIVILSAALALLQNSQPMAVLAAIGGFAAPILVSSGSGNYIALFSFYALLNIGILAMAHYRLWEWLNLIGFTLTFGIGMIWGVNSYTRDKFITVEPFLILFFLIYTAVSVMSFLKSSVKTKREESIDLVLAFGAPFLFCIMQAYMVRDIPYGLAVSSLGLGALYILIAKYLWSRVGETSRLLVEVFVSSGVVFTNLAIPLALSGQWTSALWAVEGLLLYLFGVRSERKSVSFFGILLQLLGGILLFKGLPPQTAMIINPLFIGGMLVAICAITSAILSQTEYTEDTLTFNEHSFILTWGLLWWYGILFNEILSFANRADIPSLLMIAASLSALFFNRLAKKFNCRELYLTSVIPIGVVLILSALNIPQNPPHSLTVFALAKALVGPHPLDHWGIAAWPLLFVNLYLTAAILNKYRINSILKGLYTFGFVWFYCLLAGEIANFAPVHDAPSLFFIAVSLSSLAFYLLAEKHDLPYFKAAAAFPIALVALTSINKVFALLAYTMNTYSVSGLSQLIIGTHPLYRWGIIAWPLFFATHYWLMHKSRTSKILRWGHLSAFLLAVLLLHVEVQYWVHKVLLNPWWANLAVLLVLPGVIYALFASWDKFPEKFRREYGRVYLLQGCGTICFFLLFWFIRTLIKAGNSAPLPYIPLLNPLELAEILCLGTTALWVLAVNKKQELQTTIPARLWVSVLTAALFIWSNVALMRVTFHYVYLFSDPAAYFLQNNTLPMGAIARISIFQTYLTVLWALWGSGLMYAGCRKLKNRVVWSIGSAVLGINTLKIFLVDLAQTGTLTRIASFMATGVVLILIGYFAPLPPKNSGDEKHQGEQR